MSSAYDDFTIEEDSTYSDMLFESYQGIFNITPPRISRVKNAADAIEEVKAKKFDLVITMSRLYGINPYDLGKEIKRIHPELPVILLLTSITDIMALPENKEGVDQVFLYNGDSSIFMAIVKAMEDKINVEDDTRLGKTRVIIIVEDSIQYYSIFLPLLYREIVLQTNRLLKEGVNSNHRRLLIRGRPKILLASSFEEAQEYYDKYAEYVLGVISDIAYPKAGIKNWNAGYDLVQYIRNINPYVPMCLQSSDLKNQQKAWELKTTFIFKGARDLLQSISKFLNDSLGFGDFVFRTEDGGEVKVAKDFEEFVEVIDDVPDSSILYHARRNNFSTWLFCRSEFRLADMLKDLRASDFGGAHELKIFLKNFIYHASITKSRGIINEFSEDMFEEGIHFSKFGSSGSLGGKGRGLAFSGTAFGLHDIDRQYEDVKIAIPDTIVITTYWYDKFIEQFDMDQILDPEFTENQVRDLILSKSLPKELRKFIDLIANKISDPIAVRSSSLLEDSQYHPLAGIYKSYMLPNREKKSKDRAKTIAMAIKLVYASTFSDQAKSFIKTIGQNLEIEKMAVIIQKIAGKEFNGRFYSTFSGVARSYNFYAIQPVKPDDGVAYLAVGHGEIITSGKKVLTYSPKYPQILPTHSNVEQSLRSSQSEFYALDLNAEFDMEKGEQANLTKYDLDLARNEDKTLKWLASVFDPQSNSIRDSVTFQGPLVIKFPFILKYNRFPLSNILIELLDKGKEAMGTEVELEFAVNLDYTEEKNHEFYLLQIRPMVVDDIPFSEDIHIYKDIAIMYSDKVLGNGAYEGITDIIAVCPDSFDRTRTPEIQMEIADFNKKLEGRKYLLLGFGRWGTADRFLGVPVKWHEIDNAAAIAELELADYQVDPSSGQHFFLNMTSTKKPYFTIQWEDFVPGSRTDYQSKINWNWIMEQEKIESKKFTTHFKLKEPLKIMIDGKSSFGVVVTESDLVKDELIEEANDKTPIDEN
ncbi:MAG: hypothetical protein INQ03_01300 [Candidatus Heimdallarchaeota archaeon]|nr:hypothetical protein [Candidatus Heimdallarchaeota archaeon]